MASWDGTSLNNCQDFETAYDAYDNNAADDFIVTAGTWDINAVRWIGGIWNGPGTPADAVGYNIAFYTDNAGAPSETPIAGTEFYVTAYTYANNEYLAELPSTVSLADGTYWISIQGVVNYEAVGQYGWAPIANAAPINGYFHRKDIGGVWGGSGLWEPCTAPAWGATEDFDLCFELLDEMPQDPILTDPASPFAFGNVAIGNTVSQTFTLQNIGGVTITISDISLDASSDAAFTITNLSTLPGSLPPDAISFGIEFTPTAYGVVNAIVNITEDLTDGITTIDISGKGVVPPANDDCAGAISISGSFPQTVSGSTLDALPSCIYNNYTIWYAIDLPYDLNNVSISFCPTPDNGGATINSINDPYLWVDCSCASAYDITNFYGWTCPSSLGAPAFDYEFLPGPAVLYFAVGFPTEMDFEFEIDVQPYISLDLTVMLEGPYSGGGIMSTDLNSGGYLPLVQPYNPALPYYDNATPEWLYSGTQTVTAIPSPDIVDWVYIQLRDANDAATATSETIIANAVGFLTSNGQVVDLDGSSRIAFGTLVSSIDKGLFAVIYHWNHLGVISNNALTLSGPAYTYDFSSDETQVYGGTNGYKQLETGVWGMVAADGNGNGLVQNTDETAVWKANLGSSGYQGGDFDLNGLTQNTDETNFWKPNLGGGGQILAKGFDYFYKSCIPK
jgi:hypothetical protein